MSNQGRVRFVRVRQAAQWLSSLALLGVLVMTAACQADPTPTPSPSPIATATPTLVPSPTPTATASPTATPTSTPIPLQDHFERQWPQLEAMGGIEDLQATLTLDGVMLTVLKAYADQHVVVLGLRLDGVESDDGADLRVNTLLRALQSGQLLAGPDGEFLQFLRASYTFTRPDTGSQAVVGFDASPLDLGGTEAVNLTLTLTLELEEPAREVGPFILDLSLPVTTVPAAPDAPVTVNQTIEEDNLALTLEDVTFSPPHQVGITMRLPQGFRAAEQTSLAILESPYGFTRGVALHLPEDGQSEQLELRFDSYFPPFEGEWELRVHRLRGPVPSRPPEEWTDEHQDGGPWVFRFEVP